MATHRVIGRPSNNTRLAAEVRRAVGSDIRTARADAGLSQAALARSAGISAAHLCGIESGQSEGSTEVLVRIADALGGRVSTRIYPGTGPRIRDHLSAAIAEVLVAELDARWKPWVEVPVYRPARGVIDLVLHDAGAAVLVASEVQSELRRLEQIVRWSNQKREALPSADLWARVGSPTVSSLLVIRSTRANRLVVNEHATLLATAYPARTRDVVVALRSDASWPGAGVIWAGVDGGSATILDGPPRGVVLGR